MKKVKKLLEEANKRDDCKDGPNAAAMQKLDRFLEDFVKLTPQDIEGPEAWHEWVSVRTVADWKEKMHFDHLLLNFGFTETTAKELQRTKIPDQQDDGSVKMVPFASRRSPLSALAPCPSLPSLPVSYLSVCCSYCPFAAHVDLAALPRPAPRRPNCDRPSLRRLRSNTSRFAGSGRPLPGTMCQVASRMWPTSSMP